MFTFLLVLIAFSPTLGENDFSCDFEYGMCGWSLTSIQNCRWEMNSGIDHGNKGSLSLIGTHNCSCSILWKFITTDGPDTNNLTMEYYVFGPGPFSLDVSHDNSTQSDWTCSIQPGNEKRAAHVSVPGSAKYLQIKGEVTEGSRIIITRISNSVRGYKLQRSCPPIIQKVELMDEPDPTSSTSKITGTPHITSVATPQSTSNRELTPTNVQSPQNAARPVVVTSGSTTKSPTNGHTTIVNKDTTDTSEVKSTLDKQTKPSTRLVSMSSTQPTSLPVTNMTTDIKSGNGTATGSSLESTLHNDQTGKTDGNKSKKIIIGVVFSLLALSIVTILVIIFIRKRHKQRNNILCDQPIRIGSNSDVGYDNIAYGSFKAE